MKVKLLMLSISLITCISVFGQGQQAGTLSFQAGYDFGVHGTLYKSQYLGLPIETDTGGAATSMFSFGAQYNLLNWLSGGVTFVYGSYLEDTSDVSANGNNVGTISFDLRLYPVNGEKFNLYIGPEVGYSFLEIRKLNPSLGNIEEVSNYSGGHVGVNLGFNWYLFSFAGVFAQAEYTRNDFTLKQYYIDGETFDLTNWDASLNTFSGAVRVGLCFKIN